MTTWQCFVVVCLLLLNSARSSVKPAGSGRIHTVSLSRQYVPVHRGDRIVAWKTAYFGTLYAGFPNPQNFTVLFDTGSGHVLLPSSTCTTEGCSRHRRYDRSLSDSATDIDYDGRLIDRNAVERDRVDIVYGTGQISGEFVQEVVCLQHLETSTTMDAQNRDDCARLRLIMASQMTSEPFEQFAFDGVAGLGLDSLALDPEFNFFGQMSRLGLLPEPCFGVFLARSDDVPSEITFGGHNEEHVGSPFQWAPVASPEQGYWQIAIHSVRVGSNVLDACSHGECRAILDTGTSMMGVPKANLSHLHWLLARPLPDSQNTEDADCRTFPGPSIEFDLGGFTVHLEAEDYSRPAPMSVTSKKTGQSKDFCRAQLMPVDMDHAQLGDKVFIFGEPILRKYYTKFDWAQQQVGFAVAKQPSSALFNIPTQVVSV